LEGSALTRRDFEEKLLPQTAWLNDNVIIGSILYIGDYVNTKAGRGNGAEPKMRCLYLVLLAAPRSAGPAQCGRLMRQAGVRKDSFLDIDTILIPICSDNHWTLAVVLQASEPLPTWIPCWGGRGSASVTSKLLEWVKTILEEKFVKEDWMAVDFAAPLQTNGWDCGLYTITNGLCMALSLDPEKAYTAGELPLQRRRLAAMLLNGGI